MNSTKYPIYIIIHSRFLFISDIVLLGSDKHDHNIFVVFLARLSSPQGNKGDVFITLKVHGSYVGVKPALL